MSANTLVHVNRRRRFDEPEPRPVMPVQASPMLVQKLLESLANLSKKVDAIVLSRPQPPEVRPTQTLPAQAKSTNRIESHTEPVRTEQRAPQREVRVNRSKLLDIFD